MKPLIMDDHQSLKVTGLVLLLCLCKSIFCHQPCDENQQCLCVTDGDATDMDCELTTVFLEIHGNFTAIRTLTITAEPGIIQVRSNFTSLEVRNLVVTGVSIADLDCNMLKGLSGLESMTIEYTKLSAIPKCALLPTDSITSLSLKNNSIKKLLTRAFSDAPTVRHLNLTRNCLVRLENETFKGIQRLEFLDLSDNCIVGILNSGVFSTLLNLKWLSVARNRISAISEDMWKYLSELEFVDLSENELLHFDNMLFYPHDTLVINLSKNRLQSVRNLRIEFQGQHNGSNNLTLELDASVNGLSKFDGVTVDGPQRCELNVHIKADGNAISVLDRDPVVGTACVDNIHLRLSMARNKLSHFPACQLSLLHRFHFQLLNMSGNSIEGRVSDLCGASEVETLDLSNNLLSAIGHIVSLSGNLENLMLAGNKISHIGENDFEKIKSNLKVIDLRNNTIASITEAVNHCPLAANIYLARNPLDCAVNDNDTGGFPNLCDFLDTVDDARCLNPPNLRALQVRCAFGENCSTVDLGICWSDSYVEADLKANQSDRGLNLKWNLVGPGKENLTQFLIQVIRLRDNTIVRKVFVHRLERNLTLSRLHYGELYKVCIQVFVQIVTSKRCVETIGITSSSHTENEQLWMVETTVVMGTIIIILMVAISVIAIRRCRKSRRNMHQTNPKVPLELLPSDSRYQDSTNRKDSLDEERPQADLVYEGYIEGPGSSDHTTQISSYAMTTSKDNAKETSEHPYPAFDVAYAVETTSAMPDNNVMSTNRQGYITPSFEGKNATLTTCEQDETEAESNSPQRLPDRDGDIDAKNSNNPASSLVASYDETMSSLTSSDQRSCTDISIPPRSRYQLENHHTSKSLLSEQKPIKSDGSETDENGTSGIQNTNSPETSGDGALNDACPPVGVNNATATYMHMSQPPSCRTDRQMYLNENKCESEEPCEIVKILRAQSRISNCVTGADVEESKKICGDISHTCTRLCLELSEMKSVSLTASPGIEVPRPCAKTSVRDLSGNGVVLASSHVEENNTSIASTVEVKEPENNCKIEPATILREPEMMVSCSVTDSEMDNLQGSCDHVSVKGNHQNMLNTRARELSFMNDSSGESFGFSNDSGFINHGYIQSDA